VKALLCGLLACAMFPVLAAEPAGAWRWYYAAYGSPAPEAKMFTRAGTASVAVDGTALRIDFKEDTPAPGERARFVGKLAAGRVSGRLVGFFPSGDETRQGEYREQHVANCRWREIALRPQVPDGSVLIVSRMEGVCQ
jgi:hypothetical protein